MIHYSNGTVVEEKLGRQRVTYYRGEDKQEAGDCPSYWEQKPTIEPEPSAYSIPPPPCPATWADFLPDKYNPVTWLYRNYSKTRDFIKDFKAQPS
jgi:hypothetical protein